MTKRKSFILYIDQCDTMINLLTTEQAGKLFKAIVQYSNDEIPAMDDDIVRVAFAAIKINLDQNIAKYNHVCERNRINGSKGGRPKKDEEKPTGFFGNPAKPKKADNNNNNDNNNDISLKRESNKTLSQLRTEIMSQNRIDQFCMSYHIDKLDCLNIIEQILSEWELAQEKEINLKHFVCVLSKRAGLFNKSKPTKEQWRNDLVKGAEAILINNINNSNN